MNVKSKTYMRNEEFKARQLWLPFADAVGIALQVMEQIKADAWAWFKAWKGRTAHSKPENRTLPLPFDRPISHKEWARRAVKLCLKTGETS